MTVPPSDGQLRATIFSKVTTHCPSGDSAAGAAACTVACDERMELPRLCPLTSLASLSASDAVASSQPPPPPPPRFFFFLPRARRLLPAASLAASSLAASSASNATMLASARI
jgi:hypothetical protein